MQQPHQVNSFSFFTLHNNKQQNSKTLQLEELNPISAQKHNIWKTTLNKCRKPETLIFKSTPTQHPSALQHHLISIWQQWGDNISVKATLWAPAPASTESMSKMKTCHNTKAKQPGKCLEPGFPWLWHFLFRIGSRLKSLKVFCFGWDGEVGGCRLQGWGLQTALDI